MTADFYCNRWRQYLSPAAIHEGSISIFVQAVDGSIYTRAKTEKETESCTHAFPPMQASVKLGDQGALAVVGYERFGCGTAMIANTSSITGRGLEPRFWLERSRRTHRSEAARFHPMGSIHAIEPP